MKSLSRFLALGLSLGLFLSSRAAVDPQNPQDILARASATTSSTR